MQEFKVKARDRQQKIIHRSTMLARTQRSANAKFLRFLKKSLGHNEFEIL